MKSALQRIREKHGAGAAAIPQANPPEPEHTAADDWHTQPPTHTEPPPWLPPSLPDHVTNPPADQPPATLCRQCQCPLAWLDPMGNVRCRGCDPPPAPAFIRAKLALAIVPGTPATIDASGTQKPGTPPRAHWEAIEGHRERSERLMGLTGGFR